MVQTSPSLGTAHIQDWQPIATAPKDGTRVRGKGRLRLRVKQMPGSILPGYRIITGERLTFWGKTSHVPIYGWNWGRDPEDQNLWEPTHWKPGTSGVVGESTGRGPT